MTAIDRVGRKSLELRNHKAAVRYVIAVTLTVFVTYGLFSLPTLLIKWRPPLSAVLACIIWFLIALIPIMLQRRRLDGLALIAAAVGMLRYVR